MGQAKQRGSYEQRKADAIKAGRKPGVLNPKAGRKYHPSYSYVYKHNSLTQSVIAFSKGEKLYLKPYIRQA